MENLVSVVIPSRNERYLNHTVQSLLDRAEGDIEILVILDGPTTHLPLIEEPRVRYIERKEAGGMRDSINTGAKEAKGKFLMKCDAHCAFDQGWDVKLKKSCKPKYTVVPRRYAINKKTWDRIPEIYYDFQYISHPDDKRWSFKGVNWSAYANRHVGKDMVALMTSQGSCWMMHRERFFELGGLDDKNYGTMGAEAQETCLKTWLSGGKYVLNRNTWYAHKKKRTGVKYRGYRKPRKDWLKSRQYAREVWLKNKWEGQVHDFNWLLEKFHPVPGWHTTMKSLETIYFIMERYKLGSGIEKLPIVIPDMDRVELVKLWNKLGYKVGAEIGVERGGFAKMMFDGIPDLKMYLVDPYVDYVGVRKKRKDRHKISMKRAHQVMEGKNAEFIRKPTETAYHDIPDNSLDFVYIDGNHKFDYALLDIILWSRKVKDGGMISGHDYYNTGRGTKCNVKAAVDAYVNFYKPEPWFLTDKDTYARTKYRADRRQSWFWIKGSIAWDG